jgi:hypothetical protein
VWSAWLVLLAAALAGPFLAGSPTAGDDITRWTVRLALGYWWLAVAGMLWLKPEDWAARTPGGRLVRRFWLLAWATYLVHLAAAFQFHHGWSHAAAVRHVEETAGFGPGIFVSHAFTLLWSADVLIWLTAPARYASRPAWVGLTLHAFMVFIVFNGTVVYETGIIRYAGVAGLLALAGLAVLRLAQGAAARRSR